MVLNPYCNAVTEDSVAYPFPNTWGLGGSQYQQILKVV